MTELANHPIEYQAQFIRELLSKLRSCHSIESKIELLNQQPEVNQALASLSLSPFSILDQSTLEEEFVIKSIAAIGQAPYVFFVPDHFNDAKIQFRELLSRLYGIEKFYLSIGGLIGYHLTVLDLIIKKKNPCRQCDSNHYIHPEGPSLEKDSDEVRRAIRSGVEFLPFLAYIYPVGGAGDRLNLIDEANGMPLPAAMLKFLGRTLLESLIRDVEAAEYLYFKLFDKQIQTPIALMTSEEKLNHEFVLQTFKEHRWFNRDPNSFRFFMQPLVPLLTTEGKWSLSSPLKLNLKPGGHGVIWKLADENGIFEWFFSEKREKILVRQINNPLAGLDDTLLALMGFGCLEKKSFGFISCDRLLNSAEGVNVIVESQKEGSYDYCLTNIEYTEFAEKGIDETPIKPGSPYSIFPSNTNILYADIASIRSVLGKCQIPGQLINMKSKVPFQDASGQISEIEGGRLESTMQNIADYFIDRFPKQLTKEDSQSSLKTFIVFNKRVKTISTTKCSYIPGNSTDGTPEQAYYDLLQNAYNVLVDYCQFTLSPLVAISEYLKSGPNFIFTYHPALGPLFSIISQKIRRGRLAEGSELQLEIAEIDIEELDLDGSVLIESKWPLGVRSKDGLIRFANSSSCRLERVSINNKGINRGTSNCYWKHQIDRHECLRIILGECSEFIAEDVNLHGTMTFEVPDYHQMRIRQDKSGRIEMDLHKIKEPTWYWQYQFDAADRIILTKSL